MKIGMMINFLLYLSSWFIYVSYDCLITEEARL